MMGEGKRDSGGEEHMIHLDANGRGLPYNLLSTISVVISKALQGLI